MSLTKPVSSARGGKVACELPTATVKGNRADPLLAGPSADEATLNRHPLERGCPLDHRQSGLSRWQSCVLEPPQIFWGKLGGKDTP